MKIQPGALSCFLLPAPHMWLHVRVLCSSIFNYVKLLGVLHLPGLWYTVPPRVTAVPFFVATIHFSTLSSCVTKKNTEVSQNQRSCLKITLWAEVLSFLLLYLQLLQIFLQSLRSFSYYKENLYLTFSMAKNK